MLRFRMEDAMLPAAGIAFGSALVVLGIINVQAAELRVLAGGGIAGPLKEIAAQFENATGHKLVIRFGTTPELIAMATGGPFDLGIVPTDVMKNANARAQFAEGEMPTVARVGLAVAVRAGAPRPNISTPEALKQTLLKARAIASIPASATGTQLAAVYEVLGIADEIKAKTKVQPNPAQIIDAVARGEADLAVFLLNVLTDPRLDVVGPFPAAVQREVVYTTALCVAAKEPQLAQAFVAYLLSPAASAIIKANGMTPG
jgi:molybdate transport system substrate-binding protein